MPLYVRSWRWREMKHTSFSPLTTVLAGALCLHINVLLEQLGYLGWRQEVGHAKVKKHNHEWSFASLDWSKTTAYVGTPSSNGIRIRLPEAEPIIIWLLGKD